MTPLSDHDRMSIGLASALCARLCHDVSSPLGTLSGTLELAMDEPDQAGVALAIAGEAAGVLVSRLRLLRAAWGGDCGPLDRVQLGQVAAGLPDRVQAVVDGLPPQPFTPAVSRILLNLLLLGADALPVGGTVALEGSAEAGVTLSAAGRVVAWSPLLVAMLADPAAMQGTDPHTVQVPLTVWLASAAGYRLSFAPQGNDPAAAAMLLLSPA